MLLQLIDCQPIGTTDVVTGCGCQSVGHIPSSLMHAYTGYCKNNVTVSPIPPLDMAAIHREVSCGAQRIGRLVSGDVNTGCCILELPH